MLNFLVIRLKVAYLDSYEAVKHRLSHLLNGFVELSVPFIVLVEFVTDERDEKSRMIHLAWGLHSVPLATANARYAKEGCVLGDS